MGVAGMAKKSTKLKRAALSAWRFIKYISRGSPAMHARQRIAQIIAESLVNPSTRARVTACRARSAAILEDVERVNVGVREHVEHGIKLA